jgi:MoaA/NifB/PqqE/SkfB family radical SAM enzyme
MSNEKTICIFPWDSLAIRPNGSAIPCAVFSQDKHWDDENNIKDPYVRENADWKKLRTKMLNGERSPECYHCHRLEDSGVSSIRTQRLNITTFRPQSIETNKLYFLELAFNNLCNLACVSCNEWFSSTWGTEKYKHGRANTTCKILTENNLNLDKMDLSELRGLKIIGGEPFMDQNNFVNLMERLDLSKITLFISTNGTNFPNKRLEYLINQCKSVKLDVSIDGFGSVNEWYRWPTKMTQVESVMDYFQEQRKNNPKIELRTHTLINIFNIWTLGDFVTYLNNRYPTWNNTWDWVKQPYWQALGVVPNELKPILKERLVNWHQTIQANPVPEKIFLVSVDRLYDESRVTLEEFKNQTRLLERERGLDVRAMVPDINLLLD